MKKVLSVFLAVMLTALALTGCGSKTTADIKDVDVDLTALSSTVVYSEVYNMMTTPDDYKGKTVKMKGSFSTFEDNATGKVYYACVIADATACCQQGLEFTPEKEMTYPDDFPELGSDIVVVGTFNTYTEGEQQYCFLENSVMDVESEA